MTMRILLVDDHPIMRKGLHLLFDQEPDMEVVGEANDGRIALELVRKLLPDIVLMDITMPTLNGTDATHKITADFPNVKVIALSIHSSKRYVSDMLKAGASGYILKESLSEELLQAVRTVAEGKIYLCVNIAGIVVDDYVTRLINTNGLNLGILTDREREVLQLISEGRSTKQIAMDLHVSGKTIEAIRRKTMEKLDIHSVAELTKYAIREGITSAEA